MATHHQFNVNNAVIHEDIYGEVYMKFPPGLRCKGKSHIHKLQKSIYSLKQVSHNWFEKLAQTIHQAIFLYLYHVILHEIKH